MTALQVVQVIYYSCSTLLHTKSNKMLCFDHVLVFLHFVGKKRLPQAFKKLRFYLFGQEDI